MCLLFECLAIFFKPPFGKKSSDTSTFCWFFTSEVPLPFSGEGRGKDPYHGIQWDHGTGWGMKKQHFFFSAVLIFMMIFLVEALKKRSDTKNDMIFAWNPSVLCFASKRRSFPIKTRDIWVPGVCKTRHPVKLLFLTSALGWNPLSCGFSPSNHEGLWFFSLQKMAEPTCKSTPLWKGNGSRYVFHVVSKIWSIFIEVSFYFFSTQQFWVANVRHAMT